MAKLSEEEQAQLEALNAKLEAPDEPGRGESVSFVVDLANEASVKLATKLGLIKASDLEDDESDDDDKSDDDKSDDEDDPEPAPKRGGYFGKG